MDSKWIWLILFAVIAALGGYVWWSGKTPVTPDTTVQAPKTDSEFQDPEAPALGHGQAPSVPGARNDNGFGGPPPGFNNAPPPGYSNTQPGETFSPPDSGPPPTTFEPVPPQAFENPDFVTPPPPPAQFDTEPVPFDDEAQVPPQQQFDPNSAPIPVPPPDEFNPPPDGDY